MKKYIINALLIITGFIILICCILEIFGFFDTPKTVIFTFDASKDTTFIVDRSGGGPSIIFNIDGYLSDSAVILITYHESKGNQNVKMTIPLDSGEIHLNDVRRDFYENHAKVSFKHLNNKKGKLKISASL